MNVEKFQDSVLTSTPNLGTLPTRLHRVLTCDGKIWIQAYRTNNNPAGAKRAKCLIKCYCELTSIYFFTSKLIKFSKYK